MQEPAHTHYAPGSLDHAISIAVAAHAGQFDKAGAPYILHPLRVMLKQTSEEGRIAAVLHDVVEDGERWTLDRLRAEGFSVAIIDTINHLTKHENEADDYEAFIARVAKNPLAIQVKLADLEDNLDITRLSTISISDLERLNKYKRARSILLKFVSTARPI